jgi:hypothetical protein
MFLRVGVIKTYFSANIVGFMGVRPRKDGFFSKKGLKNRGSLGNNGVLSAGG